MNALVPLPAPTPSETPETAHYWEATAEKKLIIQRCTECGAMVWYPRRHCPECDGSDLVWITCSGRGTVYSHTTIRQGTDEFADVSDYVLAYVELEEGPRVLTNIVGRPPADVKVGMPVSVEFHPTAGRGALIRFHPAV